MSHAHLSIDAVSHNYADRRVLTGITFSAAPGDRLGLIGENGTGKSTLLRIIAGSQRPDAGSVMLPGSVGLLEQQLPYPDETTVTQMLDDAQRTQLQTLEDLQRLGEQLAQHPDDDSAAAYAVALETADRTAAWSAEAKRGEALSGLGLDGVSAARPIGELSGGQRLRLALAALLLRAPQTLLLDEPSNHLDEGATAYLESVLRDWSGIVIVASHDRTLLDAITTRILDLDALPTPARLIADFADDTGSEPSSTTTTDDTGSGYGARLWGLGYSEARSARREELARWRELHAAESAERAALTHEIEVGSREVNRKHESKSESRITRKYYADKDARVTARRARNARVRLETLDRERVRRPPEPLRFRGFTVSDPVRAAPAEEVPLVSADKVTFSGRLSQTSIELTSGDRLLLAGPNGSGKSTLLAILAGELTPGSGTVELSAPVGYLPQEVSFPDPARTANEAYRAAVGFEVAERAPLESTGLLAPRDADRRVGQLSVGQRRRVALAALVADPPPLLLLDEPTNHLSLTLVEELEEALHLFAGALIIATHDRWLRARWQHPVLNLRAPARA